MKKIIYWSIIASLVLTITPTATFAVENDESVNDDSLICTRDTHTCPDGSVLARTAPDCEFPVCPDVEEDSDESDEVVVEVEEDDNVACTDDAMECPDGTFVGRVGDDCEFAECPDVDVDNCLTSELITCDPDKTVHMVLYVRWGNVLDTPSSTDETNFDGSISLSSDDMGHVSLIRTLLFDYYFNDRDKITSKQDPVAWQSSIFGHWDGVSILVSAKANDTITINTTQGSISRTAESFFESGAKIVEDVGDGREIVVKALPYKKRPFLIQFLWGGGQIGSTMDFTGSAVINDGAYGKRYKTVRFEPEHGDKITSVSKTSVYWDSYIGGGYDGILAHLIAEKDIDNEDTITVSFDNLSWSQDFSILELYHNRVTKVEIPVVKYSTCQSTDLDDSTGKCPIQRPYVLRIAIVRLPNNKIVKVPGKPAVYKIEDDTAKPILSAGVFKANGFAWTDLEEISQDELDTYADGENLNYPDGTLIKGSGPAVFVVSNGQKRPLVSASAFLGLGYKWGNIKKIRDAEVAEYDTGDSVDEESNYPEGSLVRLDGTAGVYRIEGGKKKPIKSADVFVSNGYHWGEILVVPQKNKNRLNQYEPGSEVAYPDGTLIKGSTPSVYVIDKGQKRPINSADDFTGSGYIWGKIKAVDDSTVSSYETGDEVIGGDA